MTKWSGGFPPPNWHHHPQQGGGHVSNSHENVEPGHVHSGRALPGGTYEHPALDPQVDELPPLQTEVIYRIAVGREERRAPGGSAAWRCSWVDHEQDELGEHVSVHLKPKASRAVGAEQSVPGSP
jgi:cell wall assembly regulator SMI1